MSNISCASADQASLYTSPYQLVYASVQVVLFITTVVISIFAFIRLCKKSIIPDSTRILLIGSLLFANIHEIAYFICELRYVHMLFFHTDKSCYPLASTNDCVPILTLIVMGITGNMLIQSALSIDRLLATVFPFAYSNLKVLPGSVLLTIVILLSASSFNIIRNGVVLDDYQLFCVNYSARMSARANIYLEGCFYLTVINIILNIILIISNRNIEKKFRFDFKHHYLTSETLKTTITICCLSIVQFLAMGLYSGGVLLMRKNRDNFLFTTYFNTIVWVYAPPYACVSLPILILFSFWNLKKQRTAKIETIRSKTETQDEHMKKLRDSWA